MSSRYAVAENQFESAAAAERLFVGLVDHRFRTPLFATVNEIREHERDQQLAAGDQHHRQDAQRE